MILEYFQTKTYFCNEDALQKPNCLPDYIIFALLMNSKMDETQPKMQTLTYPIVSPDLFPEMHNVVIQKWFDYSNVPMESCTPR